MFLSVCVLGEESLIMRREIKIVACVVKDIRHPLIKIKHAQMGVIKMYLSVMGKQNITINQINLLNKTS